MTADDLRAIAARTDAEMAERRAYMERACEAIKAGLTPDVDMRALGISKAEADRIDLLSLVRQIAETDPRREQHGWLVCHFCGCNAEEVNPAHEPTCLWAIAQGAKP